MARSMTNGSLLQHARAHEDWTEGGDSTRRADGFAMVELPYKGDDLSMVVIAPNKTDGLDGAGNEADP